MKKTNTNNNATKNFKPVDCFQCKHMYITWDQNSPKGCRAFGFKTKRMPSLVVFETSGEPCHNFSPKDPVPPPKKIDWIA